MYRKIKINFSVNNGASKFILKISEIKQVMCHISINPIRKFSLASLYPQFHMVSQKIETNDQNKIKNNILKLVKLKPLVTLFNKYYKKMMFL
jgi:hypothetical protein